MVSKPDSEGEGAPPDINAADLDRWIDFVCALKESQPSLFLEHNEGLLRQYLADHGPRIRSRPARH